MFLCLLFVRCVRDSPTLNGCFVVVGDDIERNQLTTVYKYHLSTLSEDDFLSLLQSEWVEPPVPKVSEDSSQEHCLWTTRYAPQSLDQICGNKEQVKKLLKWLEDWCVAIRSFFLSFPLCGTGPKV
jgi:replication factor C subunit 1